MSDPSDRSDDDLYSVAEVAERLKFSKEFIRRQIRDGRLKCVRFSPKDLRIRPSQLEAFIADFERQS